MLRPPCLFSIINIFRYFTLNVLNNFRWKTYEEIKRMREGRRLLGIIKIEGCNVRVKWGGIRGTEGKWGRFGKEWGMRWEECMISAFPSLLVQRCCGRNRYRGREKESERWTDRVLMREVDLRKWVRASEEDEASWQGLSWFLAASQSARWAAGLH